MKVALFGATGQTGIYMVKELLNNNYDVKVLARNPKKLGEYENKVEVVKGPIEDGAKVGEVIKDSDAVISVLGHVKGTPKDMQLNAAKTIVAEMKKSGIKRLIVLTGAGVFAEGDQPKFIDNLMTGLLKIVAPARINDGVNYVREVQNSELDWTVVRVPVLNNNASKGFIAGFVGQNNMDFRVSREDVAKFMVNQIEDKTYIHKLPYLAWGK